jgi:hypothetical protein
MIGEQLVQAVPQVVSGLLSGIAIGWVACKLSGTRDPVDKAERAKPEAPARAAAHDEPAEGLWAQPVGRPQAVRMSESERRMRDLPEQEEARESDESEWTGYTPLPMRTLPAWDKHLGRPGKVLEYHKRSAAVAGVPPGDDHKA